MSEKAINPDREQQRHDNEESRRQSGLEPHPADAEPREGQRREDGERDDAPPAPDPDDVATRGDADPRLI